jgi:hypothetical protein
MATTLGQLLIVLQAETSAFARGMTDARSLAFTSSAEIVDSLKRVGDQLGKLKFDTTGEWKKSAEIIGGVVAGIGTAVAASSIIVAKEVGEQVKQMSKLSQSYGLSVSEISQLRVASKLTGVDMETLTMGLGRMAKAAATAAEGGKMQAQAFAALGVSVTDGSGHLRPMNDLLLDVAGRFSKLQDGTGKTALAMQLFGRSGAALIPFLDRGKEGIQQLLNLSDELGMTWSKEDADAALIFQQRLELLDLKGEALKENFVKGLMPALDGLSTAFIKVGADGSSMAKTLGAELGAVATFLAEKFDWLTTKIAQAVVIMKGPEADQNFSQFLESAKYQLQALTDMHSKFVSDMEAPPKPIAPLGESEPGGGNPTFSPAAKKNPESGLEGLLNSSRELINKSNKDALTTEISNIEHLKQEMLEFAASHPEKIFLELNAAIEKLNATEHNLITSHIGDFMQRDQKGALTQTPIYSDSELAKGSRDQLGQALSVPVPPPSVGGEVQQDQERLHLGQDLNEQNRERLQIYQQTRTPLEQYQEQVAKLNTLYKDHSSTEYTRALADAKEKMLGIFDPMQKLVKQQQELNQEYASGLLSEEAYTNETKKLELAMDELKLKTGGVRDGLRIFFQQSQQQAQSWATQVHTALTSAFSGIESAMSRAFTQMIMGTKTVGQAFREMGQAMLQAIVEACAQMVAKWIVTHVIMAVISKIFGKVAAVSEAITGATTNSALATSAAFLGAANAYAYWAWNPPVAATMAGAALSAGLGFAASALTSGLAGSVASAAGGMEVTHDQLAFIHKDEKVLPASISRGFNSIINSFNTPQTGSGHTAFAGGGGAGGGASSLRNMSGMTIHVHGASNPVATAKQVGRVVDAKFAAMSRRSGVR